MKTISLRFRAPEHDCVIKVGSGISRELGVATRDILGNSTQKIAIISNAKVFKLFGREVTRSLRDGDFKVNHWVMNDGERYKRLSVLEKALGFLSAVNLGRTDAVLTLGGGVVGDLGGLAAALHLRGVALLHAPTTLLAQIDASIGGKTAVNTRTGKNVIGAFHQPRLVWVDTATLKTLPQRELTSGWCEAVKHGAAGNGVLFRNTYQFLQACSDSTRTATPPDELLAAHCAFKGGMVALDERESTDRFDPGSRRILNFGHTTAHALETATDYRRFRHGEAVGYGMIVAGEISERLGLLERSELELLRDAIRLCGRLPRADDLDVGMILRMIAHDKKIVRGEMNWVLLKQIGRAEIIEGRRVSSGLLRASLRAGLQLLT